MKTRLVKFLGIMLVALFMVSCGGKETKATELNAIKAETVVADEGEDLDEILDNYEKYVDQYIQLYEKAMAGDVLAMAELNKANTIATELEDALDEMTSTQLSRYKKISTKLEDILENYYEDLGLEDALDVYEDDLDDLIDTLDDLEDDLEDALDVYEDDVEDLKKAAEETKEAASKFKKIGTKLLGF